MTQIGSFDLERKAAVVAVILEKPLEASKKRQPKKELIFSKSGWIYWE